MESPFIKKVQEDQQKQSFGNDRAPFYSQYEHEQVKRDENIQATMKLIDPQIGRSQLKGNAKIKKVMSRAGDFSNQLAKMQEKTINNKSTIVGPTIKPGSLLSGKLPEIGQKDEPILQMDSGAYIDDVREIDGINFWSATEQ